MSKSLTIRSKSTQINKTKKKYRNKLQTTNRINIILLLILIVVTVNKISQMQSALDINRSQSTSTTAEPKNLQINAVFMIRSTKRYLRTNAKTDQPCRTLAIILLILSNDVHPHPGPKPPTKDNCSVCNSEVQKEDSLQCEMCRKWCHFRCLGTDKENAENSSFEWICPSVQCRPNHHDINHTSLPVSPNRYRCLDGIQHANQYQSPPQLVPRVSGSQESNATSNTNYKLLKELTKISPKDFQGKDLCRSCYKEVKYNIINKLFHVIHVTDGYTESAAMLPSNNTINAKEKSISTGFAISVEPMKFKSQTL